MGSYRKKWLAGLLSVSLLAGSFGGFRTASADTKEVSEGTVTSVKADKLPAGDVILPEAIPLSYTDTVKLSSVPVYYAESAPDLSGLDPVISGGIGSYGKEKLGDAQKNFYDSLEKACVEFLQSNKNLDSGSVYAGAASYKDCGLTKDQALKTYITFYYDHPAYFWLGGYGTDDSKLYVAVRDDYFKDTVRDSVESMIISGVGAYAAEAAKYSDVWEKVRAIHDKMILDVEYAYKSDGKTPENTSWAHTVEGVFNTARKEVVCEGYSKAFSLITNYLGIPSVFIVGNAGGAHAWNAVSFDGGNTYSYMDLTWDDAKGTEISYQWFAMPKKNFESKHEAYKTSGSGWNWQYGLPTLTTDMTYTYFSKKNAYATAAVVKDDASARTFLQKAGAAASAPTMVILADTKEIIGLLTKAQAGVS
ncbi:MAG: hypothetical protein IJ733_05510, partial [Lachnospiraceae bacterium]|nr:hypothetical protein [Lachnospiraceae bacterium]